MTELQYEFEYTQTMANKIYMAKEEINATLKKYGVKIHGFEVDGELDLHVKGKEGDKDYFWPIDNTLFSDKITPI